MQLHNVKTQFILPARFDSRDIVSINFRHFILYLRSDIASEIEGDIVEVRFLWTEEAIAQNHAMRLNNFPRHALSMLELIEDRIEQLPCTVAVCETSKSGCNIAIATQSPQLIYTMINEMICPNKFTMPVLYEHNCSSKQFIDQRLRSTEGKDE
ncbi:hypothetical protein OPS25_09670 [Alteromonas ponticola]|uniref:Uncharacterized protein n=1 Tax=Alteromonas aquimaris TaxID=2998417 RepID=A0ABT3P7L4_9ALTE|nr:hypothetical protein [Alteromonas aquimaris]MCW8108761.1 hypothetical protein [Alteromonas aquimaris]